MCDKTKQVENCWSGVLVIKVQENSTKYLCNNFPKFSTSASGPKNRVRSRLITSQPPNWNPSIPRAIAQCREQFRGASRKRRFRSAIIWMRNCSSERVSVSLRATSEKQLANVVFNYRHACSPPLSFPAEKRVWNVPLTVFEGKVARIINCSVFLFAMLSVHFSVCLLCWNLNSSWKGTLLRAYAESKQIYSLGLWERKWKAGRWTFASKNLSQNNNRRRSLFKSKFLFFFSLYFSIYLTPWSINI